MNNSIQSLEQRPHSKIYNFFFHPTKTDDGLTKAASYATQVILTTATLGTWQIAYWSVNLLESKDRTPVEIGKTDKEKITQALSETLQFDNYLVAKGTENEAILTGVSLRPANLFFNKLFKNTKIKTTLPGSDQLFAFSDPQAVRKHIFAHKAQEVISFSAKGVKGKVYKEDDTIKEVPDLKQIFGDNSYQISYGELQETLNSQKIYLSPALPLKFYLGLKQAMLKDGIVTLPGDDNNPVCLRRLYTTNCNKFLIEVVNNYGEYGFDSRESLDKLFNLNLYQLGSMVVKVEDFRIFINGQGKILKRTPGRKDALRLINACGIRSTNRDEATNKKIMTDTFTTSLIAAGDGMVVFPAVGMGVWGGNPDLYWRAFLDALLASGDKIKQVFINPGHQQTRYGKYKKCSGNELEDILNEYSEKCEKEKDVKGLRQLKKVINLYQDKKDIVQLAYNLKIAFPDEIISLFNASDPDVTLGNHVGEYVNALPHTSTTEENYTAMGTNGLCFETITKVHEESNRVLKF